jgi:hypothetical protein|tara:strand:+ start:598 stop:798 length:201 start_codon:yes stop_codon:yes gene_type:complete
VKPKKPLSRTELEALVPLKDLTREEVKEWLTEYLKKFEGGYVYRTGDWRVIVWLARALLKEWDEEK